ncbi:hypothetical protein [Streptomyces sp. C8S0]|uniref:hypothetical protein n=1 Tax=Streptomyces sp. C8S0 TaxID=2585716 RepID=UPI001D039C17|nr:hypothetical protein [Streptomyces sp. C8S0]
MDELMSRYDVVRFYGDPPYWESEMDAWAARYGEKRVVRWYTNRVVQMHAACERLLTDVAKADSPFRHDGCEQTSCTCATRGRRRGRAAGTCSARRARR